jgi:hypothetical protein
MALTDKITTPAVPPYMFLAAKPATCNTGNHYTPACEASQTSMTVSVSESSAPTEWTTSSSVAASQPQTQETARIILAALPKNVKSQLVDATTKIASAETSHRSTVTRDHQAPYRSPITSGLGYSSFQRRSPETISSIYTPELPPRPNKRSFLQRLHVLSGALPSPTKVRPTTILSERQTLKWVYLAKTRAPTMWAEIDVSNFGD